MDGHGLAFQMKDGSQHFIDRRSSRLVRVPCCEGKFLMKTDGAETFDASPDLTELSLRDAFVLIGKPQIATLRVAPQAFYQATRMLKHIGADTLDNPLTPQINLLVDHTFKDYDEWSLEIDGRVFWSPGA
jgi:hypothetical protein